MPSSGLELIATTVREGVVMFNTSELDSLTDRLLKVLPPGIKDLQRDIEKNLRAALQGGFEKLDIVSRSEFDVQCAVLARTRAKLETLEQQIAVLEAALLKKS